MLFDLRGKRKRMVQVSYAALALIFLVGFVGFSIGSGNAPGGLLDAIGLGGNGSSSGSTSAQFDDQIDAANQQLAKNPKNTDALIKLAKYEYFKGKQGVSSDPNTGAPTVSDDAQTDLGNAVDAWEKYVKLSNGKPDPGVAGEMVQAYFLLNDAQGAAQAQRIVAEDNPSSGSYGQLAFFLYASGDISGGDAAADKAVSMAPGSQAQNLKKQLDGIRAQAVKLKKQQAKAPPPTTPGANPLQNPFGGVGSGP
jgi:hypothetical protein